MMTRHAVPASSLLTLLLMATACAPDEEPRTSTPVGDDMSTTAMQDAAPDLTPTEDMDQGTTAPSEDADMTQEPDADMTDPDSGDANPDEGMDQEPVCEPLTECPEEACGELEDGCGGVFTCEACTCLDGTPVEERCGPCGLGVSSCDVEQGGSFATCTHALEALAEVTDCARLIHVSAGAAAGGTGTRAAPFATYTEAREALMGEEPGVIFVAPGTYEEVLHVRAGVHVVGGMAPDEQGVWREGAARALFRPARSEPDPAWGLIARQLSRPTLVAHVEVVAPDAAEAGGSSYGAYVLESQGLTLQEVEVKGGRGSTGAPGVTGARGQNGAAGGAPLCLFVSSGDGFYEARGGSRGENASCPLAHGGRGGRGAHRDASNTMLASEDGARSADMTAAGGARGLLSTDFTAVGSPGDAGDPGAPGEGGAGGALSGTLIEQLWVTTSTGTTGTAGTYGSGGGGAGTTFAQGGVTTGGFGGGGGGSGGCGGMGGTGGAQGGASFGMLAIASNVTLVDSTIIAGGGGTGGRGGDGGAGGNSGKGTAGIASQCPTSGSNQAPVSGTGGNGGKGGDGGKGGGGAGGPSFGLYCSFSQVALRGSSEVETAIIFASGGQGGTPGTNGRVESLVGCMMTP